jgi:hypothetical protein
MEALCSVAEARHPDILQNGIAILAELPAAEAARLADLAVGWLKRDGRVLHSQAPNDLVRKLAESGEVAATTKVARELFRLWEDNGKIRNHFGEHMYEHYLPLLIGPLIAACGSEFLEVLIDCLRQALTVLGDYSYASFSRTPVSHVNSPPFDLSDMLMSAVRQVAEELVRSRAAPMSKVIGMLAVNKYKIFTRITLHILAEEPELAPELATSYLLNHELATGEWCNPEYASLAITWFPALLPENQTSILKIVDTVPNQYLDWWRIRFEEENHVPPTPEEVERFQFNCTRDLLWRWRFVLPSDRREPLEIAGDPNAWRLPIETPDENPPKPSDFSNRPPAEFIKFLKEWQPTDQSGRLTISALAQEVREAANSQAHLYSAMAEQFSVLKPIYIRRLLEGLQQAAANQKQFEWTGTLKLIEFVCTKTVKSLDTVTLIAGDDSTLDWTRKAACELLMTGLRLGRAGIGIEHKPSVRSLVIRTVALVPRSIEIENFEEKFEKYPYFTAQQTFRGIVTELCILLARWQNMESEPDERILRNAVTDDPELAMVLQRQLSDYSPDGRIPRAIMGRYLRMLHHNDEAWTVSHMVELMPVNEYELRHAAWRAHLMNDGGPLRALTPELHQCYAEEIARLSCSSDDGNDHDSQRLAEYMMVLVLWGVAPQPLIDEFTQRAPPPLRRRAMWFLGNQVSLPPEQVPEEMRQRGLAYWEARLATATAAPDPSDYAVELGTIDHWCFRGTLDELWLSDQILRMLAVRLVPTNGYHTIKWLQELAVLQIDRAVDILSQLIQHADQNRWSYMTNQSVIRFILNEGRKRGTSETVAQVSRTISYLASLGDPGYLDLDSPATTS